MTSLVSERLRFDRFGPSDAAADEVRRSLYASLEARCIAEGKAAEQTRLRAILEQAFDAGGSEAYMDCYHVSRERRFESEHA